MKACLKCGQVFDNDDTYNDHNSKCNISEPKPRRKNALPERFGIILILYGILQMPVYYFVIRLSYNHEIWFQALEITSVNPGIVFYSIGLLMVSTIVLIGGIALILTRDKKSTINTLDELAEESDFKP